MIRFKFDALLPNINKPLLLMVGESDNYPQVHFLDNVKNFAKSLSGLGECITVQDTGHSIHNERPYFLANQAAAIASIAAVLGLLDRPYGGERRVGISRALGETVVDWREVTQRPANAL